MLGSFNRITPQEYCLLATKRERLEEKIKTTVFKIATTKAGGKPAYLLGYRLDPETMRPSNKI